MNAGAPLRVGIDVGGTFTDVVFVDGATRAIVARVKVPTSHGAVDGVSAGIVAGIERALAESGIDPGRIAFIAHSTTQATNALLEGDVARVGIVGLHGAFGWLERSQLRVPPIALGAGNALAPEIAFARRGDDAGMRAALDALVARGVTAIAASEAFAVDAPGREATIVAAARERGLAATAGHEVASTYGLRARTRTAVLNAAILPKMERTAASTARAVAAAGIAAPLMIMRSDGGVMDVGEVARRPILTMLSGPAAGVAGALLHDNVADGIFIEVGGTSADCSVIRGGRPQTRSARIGGHRTMLRTLDVRTLAIAGGSVPRVDLATRGVAALRDVGPRSAHIAGLAYACFAPPDAFEGARVATVRPLASDPDDYLALACADGARYAVTPTCAANLLGYVPAGDFARADPSAARAAFAVVGKAFGVSGDAFARALLERAADKVRAAIDELALEYDLPREHLELIGGGGGAAALVPFAAERHGVRHRLARDAEVISPLGVALALVRDVVERTIVAPTPDDVVRVRREALERVVAAGAAAETAQVTIEIDARRNLVRATASGATAACAGLSESAVSLASDTERRAAAARAFGCDASCVERAETVGTFALYARANKRERDLCVVDERGIARLVAYRATLALITTPGLERALRDVLENATAFGDVGRALPSVSLVYGTRIADLGTLAEPSHVIALALEDVRGLDRDAAIAIVAARKDA